MVVVVARRSVRSIAAELEFHARVAGLGGQVTGEWNGYDVPISVICSGGHCCAPRPNNVRKGRGICRICAGNDPAAAEREFHIRVAELGGRVVGEWNGANTPIATICHEGHDCLPYPSSVKRGQGICRTCAGRDSAAAEREFHIRVAELGGRVVGEWSGSKVPTSVICREGHACSPRPNGVQQGGGLCRICARHDSVAAEQEFRARVIELGGQIVGEWNGANTPIATTCSDGHACMPRPSDIQKGQGLCRTCAGLDPAVVEREFRARVTEFGGRVVGEWNGAGASIAVICREGHACSPRPNSVQQGGSICRVCAGKTWNAIYVVADDVNDHIKFGITSGDPRPRLRDHERDGFDRVVRLMTNLPGTTAPDMERAVIGALKLAGVRPVRGREYFDRSVLALVLDIVDHYPIPMEEK